jgi:hypothetical protein
MDELPAAHFSAKNPGVSIFDKMYQAERRKEIDPGNS